MGNCENALAPVHAFHLACGPVLQHERSARLASFPRGEPDGFGRNVRIVSVTQQVDDQRKFFHLEPGKLGAELRRQAIPR